MDNSTDFSASFGNGGPHDTAARRQRFTMPQGGEQPDKQPRDWKRVILIIGLGALSWVATYVGMLELIEANMGDLPLVHRLIIGFSVAMLMTMIIWLLDQLFKPHPFITKVFYAGGYIFLSLISIGFGFGFYWKVLESRSESSRSAESAVTQVQGALNAASTRLEQLQSTLVQLTGISTQKAEIERTKGTSCPNSKPGDGPRRKMREDDAQRFSFASKFVEGRVSAVKGDMAALDGDLVKIVSDDKSTVDLKSGTRNEFMRGLGRKLDMTVTGFNAFRTDPQLRQIRTDLADRAERSTFGDAKSTILCPDAQLQMALRGVVKAIDQLPELEKPQIAAVEGSEATIEAFRRLTTTFYGMLAFKMPPSADELRELQKKAVQSVEAGSTQSRQWTADQGGLSKRDYVPLAVALFVDLCLFLVSMVSRSTNRLSGLLPKMQAAERGPVIQILSRFNDIHKDRQIRENFEIFRHVVFDMNGDYYVAVPLDAPPRLNPQERENLRVEAQLLGNLFASFEKEKIFKRTLLPTTGSIQKRLKRQGSKFAGAEAFRVYKFTDGAWSDIILGAVMGAARRIEDAKMPAQTSAPRTGPTRPPVGPQMPQPSQSQSQSQSQQRPPDASVMRPIPASSVAAGNLAPSSVAASNLAPSSVAASNAMPTGTAPNVQPAATAASASFFNVLTRSGQRKTRSGATAASTLSLDPEHAARFGPYAQTYAPMPPRNPAAPQSPRVPRSPPPPMPEAEVTVRAANSNTASPTQRDTSADAGSDDTGVVVPMMRSLQSELTLAAPQAQPPQTQSFSSQSLMSALTRAQGVVAGAVPGMVDVTLSRETATFSVPVTEAVMPDGLRVAAAQAKADQSDRYTAPTITNYLELEPLEDAGDWQPGDAHDAIAPGHGLTPQDIALLRRMAPPAAE